MSSGRRTAGCRWCRCPGRAGTSAPATRVRRGAPRPCRSRPPGGGAEPEPDVAGRAGPRRLGAEHPAVGVEVVRGHPVVIAEVRGCVVLVHDAGAGDERQQVWRRTGVGEPGLAELPQQRQVVLPGAAHQPMTFGMREEYTAKMRLSPPSTGSRYTMSALVRFVGGRASAMLSIFATITRPRALTGSPVNGDSSCAGTAVRRSRRCIIRTGCPLYVIAAPSELGNYKIADNASVVRHGLTTWRDRSRTGVRRCQATSQSARSLI